MANCLDNILDWGLVQGDCIVGELQYVLSYQNPFLLVCSAARCIPDYADLHVTSTLWHLHSNLDASDIAHHRHEAFHLKH
ncbi:hypothetical protein WT55_27990 [Burkholderia pseudomultivorans]|nr:hypothetical protein WT55_27990 [Burkholderia pseudomultivorans]